ncbi:MULTISPECIES: AlpA family transcriptional regulator [unclassified Pseudomonas]|uniref:helix-turn-helix transcriptional regulator n=1 Tax=unclassified Pseudomonas TaxID=196821 RepID=UPI00159F7929|nr:MULTISPECIES: AlpA family phage regulatory protein [unclassified Pseudomonas]NWC92673.1 AlpA family phage regulatory protein [Pseudomonas sp. IPO3779]NWD17387.1 AlpA family phage regulatory protein [Pseudomonas sp. IPO3778]
MSTAQKNEQPIEYIRIAEVRRISGLSTPTIYRLAVGGKFPRQAKVGLQAVAWVRAEVERWAAGRAAERAP